MLRDVNPVETAWINQAENLPIWNSGETYFFETAPQNHQKDDIHNHHQLTMVWTHCLLSTLSVLRQTSQIKSNQVN